MKSKGVVLIIAVVVILAVIGLLITLGKPSKEISPLSESGTEESSTSVPTLPPKPPVETMTTLKDEAGFSFQYPNSISINKHPEDNTNYSHLDLTVTGKEGGVFVLAEDSKYKTLDLWTKNDKRVKAGSVVDSTLGNKVAKKVLGTNGEVTIGVIDDNILFTVKLTPDKEGYWKNVFDQIISSFEFTPIPGAGTKTSAPPASSDTGTGDVIEEEEEIVE